MKFNKIFIPLFLTFTIILGIAQPVVAAVKTSEDISNKVFRLHILANSNSTEDQNTKLMLKNFILENSEDVIGGKMRRLAMPKIIARKLQKCVMSILNQSVLIIKLL